MFINLMVFFLLLVSSADGNNFSLVSCIFDVSGNG